MERFLGRLAPYAYALLRIIAGLMLACHGGAHVFGMFTPAMKMPLGSLIGVAGIIELVGGFLVAFGLFGSPAAFLASGTLAVAYFMAHAPHGLFPILNHGEPAALYSLIMLLIACRGSGILSIDQLLNRAPVLDRERLRESV